MPVSSTADGELPQDQTEGEAPQVLDATAESSTATGSDAKSPDAQDRGSMLDAIKAAMDGPKGESSDPGAGETAANTQTGQKAADGAPEAEIDPVPSEEELKRYVPKTRERIEKLVGALKEKSQEVQAYSEKAQAFDQILGTIRGTGLEPNELDMIVEIGSLIKRDPQQALERLRPIYEHLSRQAGDVLPDDLSEDVRLGYVSEPRARELARARAGEQIRTQQLHQYEQQAMAERAQVQQQQQVRSIATEADRWDAQKRQADPDYHLKQNRIAELTELEILRRTRSGRGIQGPNEVAEICDAAYKTATDEIKRLQPAPRQVIPASGSASPRAQTAPKTLLEAMQAAVGAR